MTWDGQELRAEFAGKYARFAGFIGSGLWNECVAAAQDETLLGHIRFCNDVLRIAPVKTFLIARKLTDRPMQPEDKQAVGAFWGFIFKEKLGYCTQRRQACHISTFRTASVFV